MMQIGDALTKHPQPIFVAIIPHISIIGKSGLPRGVVQLSESNRKGMLSRWRKEAQKKKDRVRKRKEKQRIKEEAILNSPLVMALPLNITP